MAWDLRGALLKKEEKESSRLMDFEFKLRARTMRLLAETLEANPQEFVARIVRNNDQDILQMLALEKSMPLDVLTSKWNDSIRKARADLIAELGDPTPHKLA